MLTSLLQVSLISALLLCSSGEQTYDEKEPAPYESPKFSIFNIERRADDDSRADREILIFEVPRTNQATNHRPHLVSLENVIGSSAAAQSPAYVPPVYPHSPYPAPSGAPTWNYQNPYYVAPRQDHPHYIAIENVLPHQQHHSRHFSLFDVNLPTTPQIIFNSYPKGAVDPLLPNPIRDNVAPSIDVRASKTDHKVHDVQTETSSRTTEIKVTTDKSDKVTTDTKPVEDPNRPSRSAEEDDPVIIFPRSTDDVDDSVEDLAPQDRFKRNAGIVSLENVVGSGQIGYPVYRYPQQPLVTQPYRYPQQPVVIERYPQKTVVIQSYPQQYAGRQPYVVGDVCPYGNCYRHG